MDQQPQRPVLEVTCPNQECRHHFKMYRPEKPGIVRVACPKCKQAFQLKVDTCEAADHSKDPEKIVQVDPTPDDVYKFMCPHCQQFAIGVPARGRNLLKVSCPKCKGAVSLVVDRPAPQTELGDGLSDDIGFDGFDDADTPKVNAVMRVYTKRRLLPDIKTDFPIVKGSYFIGRADPDEQPEIPITGDTTVSRRSVQVEVIKGSDPDERLYSFTVIKATNPVTVNGKRLRAGESVFLNFDDKITMGKTELVFMRDSHK